MGSVVSYPSKLIVVVIDELETADAAFELAAGYLREHGITKERIAALSWEHIDGGWALNMGIEE